jgi:hypothetical protein
VVMGAVEIRRFKSQLGVVLVKLLRRFGLVRITCIIVKSIWLRLLRTGLGLSEMSVAGWCRGYRRGLSEEKTY